MNNDEAYNNDLFLNFKIYVYLIDYDNDSNDKI